MSQSAIDRLYDSSKWGQGLSLYRNRWLHDQLPCADWIKRQNALKITGSNGKGSVALFTGAILEGLGFRTGCFTSPHLFHITERLRIGGTPIGSDDLEGALESVFPLVDAYERDHPRDTFGTFEILTAAALEAFARAGCKALVIEAGVGGRLDVTRLIPGNITAITSIDLEHQAILGPTREHILYDKADLCPPDGTLVCGLLAGDLEARLASYLRLTQATPAFVRDAAPHRATQTTPDGFRANFEIDGVPVDDVTVNALGAHQMANAAQSMLLVKRWLEASEWPWDARAFAQACRTALSETKLPLRLERVRDEPAVIADVCHSPDAARKAAQSIQEHFPETPIVLVTGASENKDARGILNALAPIADHIICTRAQMMGKEAEDLAGHLPTDIKAAVDIEDTLETAVTQALTHASTRGGLVLIAGGLFLAAEAVAVLRGQKRETLKFL